MLGTLYSIGSCSFGPPWIFLKVYWMFVKECNMLVCKHKNHTGSPEKNVGSVLFCVFAWPVGITYSDQFTCFDNLVPRSLVYKAEGKIWPSRKIQFFWLARMWVNDVRVVSCTTAPVQFILCKVFSSSVQNIFTDEVVFVST